MTISIEETRLEPDVTIEYKASELTEVGAIVDCAHEAARLLKLVANEKRLVILCFLATRGEMPVGALVQALGLSRSALSQHLAKLPRDGLVFFRRESQTLHYRLADGRVMRLLCVLAEIFCTGLQQPTQCQTEPDAKS
jgi:DNA-binding transcriptional ArsR family regulator